MTGEHRAPSDRRIQATGWAAIAAVALVVTVVCLVVSGW